MTEELAPRRLFDVARRGWKASPELREGTRVTVTLALLGAVGRLVVPILVQQSIDRGLRNGHVRLGLIGVGTFFAQATATGFVGRAATSDRGSASGLYLASYFLGGLVGSAVLGQVFDRLGWTACVIGIGASLVAGGLLAIRLEIQLAAEAPPAPSS